MTRKLPRLRAQRLTVHRKDTPDLHPQHLGGVPVNGGTQFTIVIDMRCGYLEVTHLKGDCIYGLCHLLLS